MDLRKLLNDLKDKAFSGVKSVGNAIQQNQIRKVQQGAQRQQQFYQDVIKPNFIQPVKDTFTGMKKELYNPSPTILGFGKNVGVPLAKTAINYYGGAKILANPLTLAPFAGFGAVLNPKNPTAGAIRGMGAAPPITAIGSFTNPAISKLASTVSAGLTPLKQQFASRISSGLANIPEGVAMRNAMGQKYTLADAPIDFLTGVAFGGPAKGGVRVKGVMNNEGKYLFNVVKDGKTVRSYSYDTLEMAKAQFQKIKGTLGKGEFMNEHPFLNTNPKGVQMNLVENQPPVQGGVEGTKIIPGWEMGKGSTNAELKREAKQRASQFKGLPTSQAVNEEVLQREGIKIKQTVLENPRETSIPKGNTRIQTEATPIKQAENLRQQKVKVAKPLEDIISHDEPSSGEIKVGDKVNLIDYLRTPDRVLKKIGLEKESILLRNKYKDYIDQLPKEINKVTEWSKQVPEESNQKIFNYLDGQKVELNTQELKVANEIRTYLSDWADKLKLPKDKQISHYITHIFEKDFIKKEFDPELARLIQNKVAGSVYDPFLEQRLGKMGYRQDTWAALDAYVKRATRKVNMDEALSVIKDKAKGLETSQYDYVKGYVDRINLRPSGLDNLLDNTIKSFVGYKFGARPTAYLSRMGRQMVYRGTLGLNPGTAVKNLTQGVNTYSKLGEKYTLVGYTKNFLKMATKDNELERVGILKGDIIEDRTINATKKVWETIDKGLFSMFELAERINRGSAYYGAKQKALDMGLSETKAIEYAVKLVRDTQFTFGSIDTPPILSSDIAKTLGQFQSFTLKQSEFLVEMLKSKDVSGSLRYILGSLFLASTVGKIIGMDWKDFIPSFRFGLPPTLNAPVEIGKNIMGVPDKYGNVPDTKKKIENIGNTLIPFIPAGTQIKKTFEGLKATNQGYSETSSGRVQYPIAQTTENKVRAGLFGKYNLPEAQNYYDNKDNVLGEKQSEAFKQSGDKAGFYQNVMDTRAKDNRIEQAKSNVFKTGQNQTIDDTFLYLDGDVLKTLDLSPIEKPKLTGNEELDKKLISKYKSAITKQKNSIVTLYEKGEMKPDVAEKRIQELNKLTEEEVTSTKTSIKKTTTKTSTKKGTTIKIGKVSMPKIRIVAPKSVKIKLSKFKSTKPKKAKKLSFKIKTLPKLKSFKII